jgi:hypothetical protein
MGEPPDWSHVGDPHFLCYRWEPEHGGINLMSRGSYHVDISKIQHHQILQISAMKQDHAAHWDKPTVP